MVDGKLNEEKTAINIKRISEATSLLAPTCLPSLQEHVKRRIAQALNTVLYWILEIQHHLAQPSKPKINSEYLLFKNRI